MIARKITFIALIAALYAAVTLVFQPISFYAIQFRISEALTILPYITRLAIPGLTIGVLIANIFSPFSIIDMIVGSLATLIAAYLTSKVRKTWLAPLPPVIVNGIIIGTMVSYLTNFSIPIPLSIAYVALGELVVCYLLGYPLLLLLERYSKHLAMKR